MDKKNDKLKFDRATNYNIREKILHADGINIQVFFKFSEFSKHFKNAMKIFEKTS